jgi:hypothetical protein
MSKKIIILGSALFSAVLPALESVDSLIYAIQDQNIPHVEALVAHQGKQAHNNQEATQLIKEYINQRSMLHPTGMLIFSTTPLIEAATTGNSTLTRYLIQLGADVHARDLGGLTALIKAALKGFTSIMRILIVEGKSDLDATNDLNQTALICATINGHAAAVALLLSFGARTDIRDSAGYTALDTARARCASSDHADQYAILIKLLEGKLLSQKEWQLISKEGK